MVNMQSHILEEIFKLAIQVVIFFMKKTGSLSDIAPDTRKAYIQYNF